MSRLTGSDAKSLMEAYSTVYEQQEFVEEEEQSKVLGKKGKDWYAVTKDSSGKKTGETKLDPSKISPEAKSRYDTLRKNDWRSKISQADPKKLSAELETFRKEQLKRASGSKPTSTPDTSTSSGAKTFPTAASSVVLAKKGGIEGKLDKSTGKFTSGAFTDTEKQRYTARSTQAPVQKPSIGTLGQTKFERRTPTSAELRAAQAARRSGASPEQALQAAQRTNLPTTGPASAKIDPGSVARSMASFKPVTPTKATASAPSTSAAASGSLAPTTAKIAAAPKPIQMGSRKPGSAFESYDAYDLVLEYLLNTEQVATVDEAHYIMLEMDSQMIQSIVQEMIEE